MLMGCPGVCTLVPKANASITPHSPLILRWLAALRKPRIFVCLCQKYHFLGFPTGKILCNGLGKLNEDILLLVLGHCVTIPVRQKLKLKTGLSVVPAIDKDLYKTTPQ